MKKPVKIILIIFIALFASLILLKGCGSAAGLDKQSSNLKNPNYVKVDYSYSYVIPNDTLSVPGDILYNIYNYPINVFSDGSSIVLNYESPYVYMNLKYRLPDSSTINTMTLARYYYNNYHYYNSAVNKYYVSYNDIIADNYDVVINGTTYNYSVFCSTNISSLPANYSSVYLTEVNDNYAKGFTDATNSIINNPHEFDLYTESEYLSYGSTKYDQGKNAGLQTDFVNSGFKTFFNTIIAAPYNVMKGLFNFEFLGVNLFNLFSFILTALVVGFVIKRFI